MMCNLNSTENTSQSTQLLTIPQKGYYGTQTSRMRPHRDKLRDGNRDTDWRRTCATKVLLMWETMKTLCSSIERSMLPP